MASDLAGITSSVISGGTSSPMSLKVNIIMFAIIVAIAAYLIYKHHKRHQKQMSEAAESHLE